MPKYISLWASSRKHKVLLAKRKSSNSVYTQLPSLLPNLAINEMEKILEYLIAMKMGVSDSEVVIATSFVGTGLFAELFLGHMLLSLNVCSRVRLCVNRVSDSDCVTLKDVLGAIGILANPSSSDVWHLRHLGEVNCEN